MARIVRDVGLSIRIDKETSKRLEEYASKKHMTKSNLAYSLIVDGLSNLNNNEKEKSDETIDLDAIIEDTAKTLESLISIREAIKEKDEEKIMEMINNDK